MSVNKQEVEKRIAEAKAALLTDLKLPGDESDVREYIEHHLAEVEESYWAQQFGEARPPVELVVGKLTIHPFWMEEALEGDADLNRVDFTLPPNRGDEVTNYLLCVEFSADGSLFGICMES